MIFQNTEEKCTGMRKANEQVAGGKGWDQSLPPPHVRIENINVIKAGFLFSMSSLASRVNRFRGDFLKEVRVELSLEWIILVQAKVKEERHCRRVAARKKREVGQHRVLIYD